MYKYITKLRQLDWCILDIICCKLKSVNKWVFILIPLFFIVFTSMQGHVQSAVTPMHSSDY